MNIDVADIGVLFFVFTPLAFFLFRIFVIPDGASLEDLIVVRMDFEWPHGVQEEEEPVRWQVERLTPRDRRVSGSATQTGAVRREQLVVGDRSSRPAG